MDHDTDRQRVGYHAPHLVGLTKRMQHGWMYSTDKTWLREQIAWHTQQISNLQHRLDELNDETPGHEDRGKL